MTGANAKIKRIYVGDKQVRPMTYTYTIGQNISTNNSIVGDETIIYKSGLKVKKVEYTTSCKSYGTSSGGKTFIQIADTNNKWYRAVSIGWGTDNYCRTEYQYSGSQVNGRNISGDNHNGNNSLNVSITTDSVTVNLNGSITTYTLSGNEKTLIETLFGEQSVKFLPGVRYGYVGPTTLIVTYENA